MKTVVALWGMARPLQLLAVALVYLLGALIARADRHPWETNALISGLVMLLFMSASIHYANEYADYETDRLTTRTPFSGGSGVLPRGDVPREWALYGMIASVMAGMVVLVAFWPGTVPALILVVGTVFGWMYSLPPLMLAWRGWGELDNALLGGLALHLYGYATVAGELTGDVFLIAMPFTLLVFLNLLATTWPDRHADAQVGKFTLATIWPKQRLRRLYGVVGVGVLIVFVILYEQVTPAEVTVLSLLVLPLLVGAWWCYTRVESPIFSVAAMVALLVLNIAGWTIVG